MHRKISDLKLEETILGRQAMGKELEAPKSHSIFNPNHNRVGTELSLQEVMREGQQQTLRRYSQLNLPSNEIPLSLLILNRMTPLGNSPLNPVFVPPPVPKKKCCPIL